MDKKFNSFIVNVVRKLKSVYLECCKKEQLIN